MSTDDDRRVEEEFDHLLWSIEAAIVSTWEDEPDLLDIDVADALGSLLRHYEAEQARWRPAALRLSPRAAALLDSLRRICDWQLGRPGSRLATADQPAAAEAPVSNPDLVRCLKRLRKSVRLWNEERGRQGYLGFVRKFILEDEDALGEYDPDVDPTPDDWLAMAESERIEAIVTWHGREDPDLANAELHAMIHLIVENQIALGEKSVVEALGRLRKQGLSRHDAIHAIGGMLAEHVRAMLGEKASYQDQGLYFAGLASLSAREWRRRFGAKRLDPD